MLIDQSWKVTFIGPDGRETVFIVSDHLAAIAAIGRDTLSLLPTGSVIGLICKSEPSLLISWFACIQAGMKPLVIQYPTRKLSKDYWISSVESALKVTGLAAILADDFTRPMLIGVTSIPIFAAGAATGQALFADLAVLPNRFDIIQLSSGTTGHRKAVEFTSEDLLRHVLDYNDILRMGAGDCIVSWLPLYHDMGYIACFVMSMLLNLPLVLIDPMSWVECPDVLFKAIRKHNGTICYMPNFGFEIMSRVKNDGFPTMRRWISCSEPVSEKTSGRFVKAVGCAANMISPCYAMAENIFAVSLASGIRTAVINGVDVVSCGKPISAVEVKSCDGELFVRSPTSLHAYLGGADIRDVEGFYPTGDLGKLIDGEIYVAGRKQDVLIQAGRKFFLSDIDLQLAEHFPEFKGRAATLAVYDDRLGTETPLLLAETEQFLLRNDAPEIGMQIARTSGLDGLSVAFVPPRFITKTSSGKVNRRKTSENWIASRNQNRTALGEGDPVAELTSTFERYDWGKPVSEILDSLSMTILMLIMENADVDINRNLCLEHIKAVLVQKMSTRRRAVQCDAVSGNKVRTGIRIVSLADKPTTGGIEALHLDRIAEVLGCEVTFEHVCLPPSPILLSDYVFHRYFEPRIDRSDFGAIDSAMDALKNASVILVDDKSEMLYLYESVYPVLSHNLERNCAADLISLRWQSYVKSHHKLPLTVASGADIPLETCNKTLRLLEAGLQVPIFKIATLFSFSEITSEWDFQAKHEAQTGINADSLVSRLLAWIATLPSPLSRKPLSTGFRIVRSDLSHFCAHMINKSAADALIDNFESFCLAGQPASAPYIGKRLQALGKRFVVIPSHSTDMVRNLVPPVDCVLLCGPFGDLVSDLPVVALQHAGTKWRTRNLNEFESKLGKLNIIPASATDWFHPFPLGRSGDRALWFEARKEGIRSRAIGRRST